MLQASVVEDPLLSNTTVSLSFINLSNRDDLLVFVYLDVITTDATTLDDSELTSSALSTSTAIEPSSSSSESPSTDIETSNFYSTSTDHTNRACVCEMSCTRGTTDSNVTSDRLEEIRSALIVDKKSLSSTKRKLISAGDDRQSSTLMGYAGAIFIAISVFFIVVGDIVNIMKWAFLKCKY
ncbi:hypothetical protein FSP39_019683 [Pinctada imbricata]|uniref:Uncharacterized protein n=1 Tax=Pinctada imbricata TaxID=66713 RepID=A0AA88XG91_PINIB|nr:hypothetical protein FSP39_019683 [Pinctada imbricata]